MPLNIIKGHYRIVGSEPDGDSVRFYPLDRNAFTRLHLRARVNRTGGAQLRLDAIDALETHYAPRLHGGFLQHQPVGLAHAAADDLLKLLGFDQVERDGEKVTAATPEQVEGYILTRFADKYGRPVCFAYPGTHDVADLAPVLIDPDLLERSGNYQLIAKGLVYPTYYSKLFPDLRRHFTDAAARARKAKRGVWADDATTSGAKITGLDALTDRLVILPKLFRRLIDYLALGAGSTSLDGFIDFLAARDDRLFTLPDGHATGFDNITEVTGQTVGLTLPPEDLVFLEA